MCATIDAFTTPKMVLYFIDEHYKWRSSGRVVSLVAFVIPDIYIFVGTRTLPTQDHRHAVLRSSDDDGARRRQHRPQDPQGSRRACRAARSDGAVHTVMLELDP